jgi:hypothetical protein
MAIFLVLVLAPLGLLGWLGVRLASGERRLVRERVEQLLLQGLAETRQSLASVVDRHRRWIVMQTDRAAEQPEALRALVRRSGVLR